MFSIILASSVFAFSALSILSVIAVSINDRHFYKKSDIQTGKFCFWKVSLLFAVWAASGVYIFG
jgi:hypothetical protein